MHIRQWKNGTFVTVCGEGDIGNDVPENGLVIEKGSDEEQQLRDMLKLYMSKEERTTPPRRGAPTITNQPPKPKQSGRKRNAPATTSAEIPATQSASLIPQSAKLIRTGNTSDKARSNLISIPTFEDDKEREHWIEKVAIM